MKAWVPDLLDVELRHDAVKQLDVLHQLVVQLLTHQLLSRPTHNHTAEACKMHGRLMLRPLIYSMLIMNTSLHTQNRYPDDGRVWRCSP
jgi:hypothetical protein